MVNWIMDIVEDDSKEIRKPQSSRESATPKGQTQS